MAGSWPGSANRSGAMQTALQYAGSAFLWVSVSLSLWILLVPKGAGAQALAEYGQISAGGTAYATNAGARVQQRAAGKSVHIMAPISDPIDLLNRKLLEQKAGDVPAKLTLKSVPTGVSVWVDETFVGRTPVSVTLAPGKHKVEMQGTRTTTVQYEVSLGRSDDRSFVFNLPARYPTRIQLR